MLILLFKTAFIFAAAHGGADATLSFQFEKNASGWTGPGESLITRSVSVKNPKQNRALQIKGLSPIGEWNYAVSPELRLKPGARYRVTGWLLVEDLSHWSRAPFLNLVLMYKGRYLSSVMSQHYLIDQDGQWQKLEFEVRVPALDHLSGQIQLCKGDNTIARGIVAFLDEIKIEPIN